jgi:hypothetical protein
MTYPTFLLDGIPDLREAIVNAAKADADATKALEAIRAAAAIGDGGDWHYAPAGSGLPAVRVPGRGQSREDFDARTAARDDAGRASDAAQRRAKRAQQHVEDVLRAVRHSGAVKAAAATALADADAVVAELRASLATAERERALAEEYANAETVKPARPGYVVINGVEHALPQGSEGIATANNGQAIRPVRANH